MAKGVVGLKGVVADKPQKKYYVFAISAQDYQDWRKWQKDLVQKEEEYEFVYVQHLDDVRDLMNIQWTVTSGVQRNPGYLKSVEEVMEIVNFKYANRVDLKTLPKVVQELMNEDLSDKEIDVNEKFKEF